MRRAILRGAREKQRPSESPMLMCTSRCALSFSFSLHWQPFLCDDISDAIITLCCLSGPEWALEDSDVAGVLFLLYRSWPRRPAASLAKYMSCIVLWLWLHLPDMIVFLVGQCNDWAMFDWRVKQLRFGRWTLMFLSAHCWSACEQGPINTLR